MLIQNYVVSNINAVQIANDYSFLFGCVHFASLRWIVQMNFSFIGIFHAKVKFHLLQNCIASNPLLKINELIRKKIQVTIFLTN